MAADVTIDTDRMTVVDGQRTFILGLYENPKDDTDLRHVADAGFNLVRASGRQESLDRLHRHGLRAWLTTGYNIDLSKDEEARTARLDKLVADFSSHPALMVWEVPDEALWNCWYKPYLWRIDEEPRLHTERIEALVDEALQAKLRAMQSEYFKRWNRGDFKGREELADAVWTELGEKSPKPGLNISDSPERAAKMAEGFLAGTRHLRVSDSKHPVWMNHAPRNRPHDLQLFNRSADIVGCDIYPFPWGHTVHSDLAERSIAAVGAYTDIMQAAAPGKPVWMVLQGFGWADLYPEEDEQKREIEWRPDFKKTRFMAYDALVHGARGIIYWGTSRIEKDSELWENLLRIVSELSDLQPVLSARDADIALSVELGPTWGTVDRGVRVLPKQVDEKTWLIVVNEWGDPLNYTLSGLTELNGTVFVDDADAREATVRNGSLTLSIAGHGVQVLAPR